MLHLKGRLLSLLFVLLLMARKTTERRCYTDLDANKVCYILLPLLLDLSVTTNDYGRTDGQGNLRSIDLV